jgi:hypothetical protein
MLDLIFVGLVVGLVAGVFQQEIIRVTIEKACFVEEPATNRAQPLPEGATRNAGLFFH